MGSADGGKGQCVKQQQRQQQQQQQRQTQRRPRRLIQTPLVTALPALSLSLLCSPRLGEVPFFDLMTSPRDRTGVEASFHRFVLELLACNGTRRRRRAERLSRLPMGVVPDAGAEVLASAPAKGGKHPAVDTFRGVDPGRPGRLVPLVSVRVARATHLRQEKKSRRLKRARSKILCPCKIRRVSLQHQQQQPPPAS